VERDFWIERWRENQIGFHLATPNPRLVEHVGALPQQPNARVLVPLCGKSIDMVWLADQGFRVLGVELSLLAAEAFFDEQGWTPSITHDAAFTRYVAGAVEILCGDFFALTPELVGELHGHYDRAALVALPATMRAAYASRLAALLPPSSSGLLVAFEYPQHEMSGPPFSVPDAEVRALFQPAFAVDPLGVHDILADEARMRDRGLTRLRECVYAIHRG
jgi:thiopurine S-methyltransferase